MESSVPRISILDPTAESWQKIKKEFLRRLPLTNLVWQNPSGRAAGRIETLQLSIDHTHELPTHQAPMAISPYLLNIYITNCDESEEYKTVEKKRIQDWITATSTTRKGLVHHVQKLT
jgi:hypothetical protein